MRRVGILLADLFDEGEFLYPRVQEAGHAPVVIGLEAREYRAKPGLPWKAEVGPKDLPAFMQAFLRLLPG